MTISGGTRNLLVYTNIQKLLSILLKLIKNFFEKFKDEAKNEILAHTAI